jgi:ATP-binding cassette, subfamily F, member 3
MHIIHLNNITINHAGRVIFRELSWVIGDRDRVGLIGPNGAGKSSILKLITGEVTATEGTVTRQRGISVGMLPQEVTLTPGRTVIEEALTLPPELAALETELSRIEAQLGDPIVYNDFEKLERVMAKHERALEDYERLGGAQHNVRVNETLIQLGFCREDFDLLTDALSGGQKKLLALARLVITSPDVLLLDEPDNHLDLAAKQRLEAFIRAYPGAVIIVSHDRYLLDEVATQIAELNDGVIEVYPGNYSAYATERELRRLRQQQLYVAQQKEIARIEAAIKRFEHWASLVVNERHIRQARSRQKMLARWEANGEIIDAVREPRRMELSINGWRGSTKALEIEGLAMGFGDDLLFLDLNLLIQHGERVGLIGENGAGKSVLFHLILGQMQPLEGTITIGPSTKIGYYSQEHQTLGAWRDRTPIDLVRNRAPISEGDAVALLTKFLFRYDHTRQPIRTLSGGERSRLQLITLMLEKPNLLLLDEPTNNLDILSAEVLEAALEDFDGALLMISHDRYFLDRTVDRVVALEDGALHSFAGGYTDYLADRRVAVGG